MELRIGGQLIETTLEHPFFVPGRGWVAAGQLQAGDVLLGHEGPGRPIESIQITSRHETVYNIRVAEHHTYFVGEDAWGFSVWVHNRYTVKKLADGSIEIFDDVSKQTIRHASLDEYNQAQRAVDANAPVFNSVDEIEQALNESALDPAAFVAGGKFRGGPHSETKLPWRDGLESHHMPAKSVTGLDPEVGPAIQMHRRDHLLTSSHGSRVGSAEYRAEIDDLLSQGHTRAAMAREIRDVRRAAMEGSGDMRKYNEAMRAMLDYARSIGFLD